MMGDLGESTVGLDHESTAAAATGIWGLFTNYALMSAFLGFAIAQGIKFFTVWYASCCSQLVPLPN